MDRSEHLKALSEGKSGRMTKSVNVFDQTVRQIRCIKKTHDYLGDGTLFAEEEMEEGCKYLVLHDNTVDFIVTHCCSSSTQVLLGGGLYKPDILTKYLEEILLYEQIIRVR